jgi:YidC/Oxa1 family membrane protein insertase
MMEQKRIFLAIALSFVVFLVWNVFFGPEPPEQQPEQVAQETPKSEEKAVAGKPYVQAPVEKQTGETIQPKEKDVRTNLRPARTITVKSPYYIAKITEQQAAFRSFVLSNYREYVDVDSPLKELVSPDNPYGTMIFGFQNQSVSGLEGAVYEADIKDDTIVIENIPTDITFTWSSENGVVIEKKYHFSPDTYLIGLTVTVKNGSGQVIQDRPYLAIKRILPQDGRAYGFTGPSTLINNNLEQIKVGDIEDKNILEGAIEWITVQDRYFISAVIPKEKTEAGLRLNLAENDLISARFALPNRTINSQTQQSFEFQLFQGPKSIRLLNSFDNRLNKAINFGWFDILAKPCLWLMNFIYSNLIPNYGIAIIILTLITKILLWPLGAKSYKSMSEMKKLQPLIKEIKEKYGDDRKKVNEETMALYRTYKINPLGGCLPMVVQIPVFFALYRMLYEAIELRHAPFFLWINDLSAPDRLFNLGFSIPLMEPPYGIPVLTLIMGASMLLQQKMSPPMGDPTQAKMMMLMPVVFTVIFINFSSGLVLYWLVNNIFSIAQQYYTQKKNA